MTRYQFAVVWDKAIVAIVLDKKRSFTNLYSLRVGAATTAFNRGFSDEEIRIAGRWKSDAFQACIRLPLTYFYFFVNFLKYFRA